MSSPVLLPQKKKKSWENSWEAADPLCPPPGDPPAQHLLTWRWGYRLGGQQGHPMPACFCCPTVPQDAVGQPDPSGQWRGFAHGAPRTRKGQSLGAMGPNTRVWRSGDCPHVPPFPGSSSGHSGPSLCPADASIHLPGARLLSLARNTRHHHNQARTEIRGGSKRPKGA